MNIPNILTVFRVLLIPLFLYLLMQEETIFRIGALLVFMIASVTDFLDGYLARKLNQESKFGRFLDPLADKFLVISALVAFLVLDKMIPLWMVLTIIGRDILITVMRILARRKNMEVKTSRLAKVKTAFQMLSIVLILCVFIARSYRVEIGESYAQYKKSGKQTLSIAVEWIKKGIEVFQGRAPVNYSKKQIFAATVPYFIMLLTTIVTIISGIRYLATNYRVLLPPYKLVQKTELTEG